MFFVYITEISYNSFLAFVKEVFCCRKPVHLAHPENHIFSVMWNFTKS